MRTYVTRPSVGYTLSTPPTLKTPPAPGPCRSLGTTCPPGLEFWGRLIELRAARSHQPLRQVELKWLLAGRVARCRGLRRSRQAGCARPHRDCMVPCHKSRDQAELEHCHGPCRCIEAAATAAAFRFEPSLLSTGTGSFFGFFESLGKGSKSAPTDRTSAWHLKLGAFAVTKSG